MANLWIPPRVMNEHLEERRRHNAELLSMVEKRAEMDHWNRELRAISDRLEIVFAPPSTRLAGLTPGRWHILNKVPDAPITPLAVTGPNGEYVDPNSAMLDMLRGSDLWNDVVGRDRARKERALQEAKARAKQREHDELREEVRDRFKAKESPSVSMTNAGSWKYRAAARTEKKAA